MASEPPVYLRRHSDGHWVLQVVAPCIGIDIPLSDDVEAELDAFYGEHIWEDLTHDEALRMRKLPNIRDRAAIWRRHE